MTDGDLNKDNIENYNPQYAPIISRVMADTYMSMNKVGTSHA